jgi:ABC-2 type transport system ATP-binding protein
MIELQRVTKIFGQRKAVDALDLTVQKGEIFGLLGHNWPTAGEVKICGHEVTANRARALSPVGAIFETPVFYDYLSGRRNLEILSAYTAPTSAARIREVVDWVGLTGRENSSVRTYSHGMRTRLALAQALLPNPELLILDEPSDGLDPEGIHEMRQTILRLQRELGLTILLSSHQLVEVEQICSRIAVLNRGQKVFEGRIADVKSTRGQVQLKTPDFAAATALLRERGIITGATDGKNISLAEGRTIAEVARILVTANFSIEGIWQHEQTLEDFYLGLIKRKPEGEY